ncbi:hypothetical protein [uncultured Devosia sp.]|uniref:hypothetical protein n=1 Tax=uncultured Devosia sp. TaxID=211434 RepID=UPI0035C9A445
MHRVFQILRDLGYPEEAIDWLRQRRAPIIVVLAVLAWLLVIAIGWIIWAQFS